MEWGGVPLGAWKGAALLRLMENQNSFSRAHNSTYPEVSLLRTLPESF